MAFCVLYLITGQVHWRAPFQLPMWRVDEMIPFIGWTVWVYFSQYALLLLGVWCIATTSNLTRLIYGLSLASLCGFLIFTLWPITLPRAPHNLSGSSAFLFQFLYSIDTPTNCFPSLHVALAWLAALAVAAEHRWCRVPVFLWAGLISLSTITTKQHYCADVLGGLALAAICQALTHHLLARLSHEVDG